MYRVVNTDNFHFYDQKHDYVADEFENYEDAVQYCKQRIEAEIDDYIKQGFKPDQLLLTWRQYGEMPIIVGRPGADASPEKPRAEAAFFASDYAEEYVAKIAENAGKATATEAVSNPPATSNMPEAARRFFRRFKKNHEAEGYAKQRLGQSGAQNGQDRTSSIERLNSSVSEIRALLDLQEKRIYGRKGTTVRERLLKDFGISINIERGSGLKVDPFIFPASSIYEAIRDQMLLLRGLCRGRSELWTVIDRRVEAVRGKELHAVRIKTVRLTDSEIIRETRSYFFDASALEANDFHGNPMMWSHEETGFKAPYQLGWLHFDDVIFNRSSAAGHGSDITLQYSSEQAKLGISIYKPSRLSAPALLEDELDRSEAALRAIHPDAKTPWDKLDYGPFRAKWFLIGPDTSLLGIALKHGHFIKVRMTFCDEPIMRELTQESMLELSKHVRSL